MLLVFDSIKMFNSSISILIFSSTNQTMNNMINNSGSVPSDVEILQEAKMLREHKGRLESRMKILEDHNLQLESQLGKLKMMLHEVIGLIYFHYISLNQVNPRNCSDVFLLMIDFFVAVEHGSNNNCQQDWDVEYKIRHSFSARHKLSLAAS